MMVSFEISDDDAAHRDEILDLLELTGEHRIQISMSLTAAHANGCPMDFPALAKAGLNSLLHDVFGLHRHTNRETGQVEGHFLPRFRLCDEKQGIAA